MNIILTNLNNNKMANTVTLGGDRLGSGKKNKISLHGFERSTHDLGHVFRTTMSPGTLVPFMNLMALPGDTFDINLGADVKTHPTLGPLFASFKLQLDVFQCPIRLYHSWLHNNKLNVGLDMARVKLPQLKIDANTILRDGYWGGDNAIPIDIAQINPSSLLSYLGIKGVGNGKWEKTIRHFNAIPYLSYWDIYKNYYANKQEEIGMMIHTPESNKLNVAFISVAKPTIIYMGNGRNIKLNLEEGNYTIEVTSNEITSNIETYDVYVTTLFENNLTGAIRTEISGGTLSRTGDHTASGIWAHTTPEGYTGYITNIFFKYRGDILTDAKPEILSFQLENIDRMREDILLHNNSEAFIIDKETYSPYGDPLKKFEASDAVGEICSVINQEGLALKTYQSDIYNNWMNTEWIDGENGINSITAIDTSGGSFDIDTLNLAKKVYDMLNRIAISGGTYDDWLSAVYDHEGYRKAETPMYMGGLSKEIIFQEVVSTAASQTDEGNNPLGTLAGRGNMSSKHKGGQVTIKVDEPSIILGIVSITPRIDYYQGNDWTVNLKTMDDLHKPNLDEIGFQDLVTDQMAYWDTIINEDKSLTFKSAGKQPAWLNYMTAVNRLNGNFADERNQMFMTLARRYETNENLSIKDLTTYIDPTKFNYAFAQTDISAQNFWVQIGMDIIARRKMSAKLMPNL